MGCCLADEEIMDSHQSIKNTSPEAWSQLTQSQNKEVYSRAWLSLLCEQIDHVMGGLVVLADGEQYIPLAQWPDDAQEIERLAEIIEEVLSEHCGLISRTSDNSINYYAIAYPIIIDNVIVAVAALEVGVHSQDTLEMIMQRLQWGTAWLELFFRRQETSAESNNEKLLRSSVDLLATVMTEAEYTAGAMALVTEAAHLINADRVSLGFWQKNIIHIDAISHTADFTQRMNLIRFLGQAMEEAIEQRHVVNFSIDQRYPNAIVLAHAELSKQHGAGQILTIPLYHQDEYFAAVIFERPIDIPFTDEEVKYAQAILGLAGTALYDKRLNDKPLYEKIITASKIQWQRLVGPRYSGRKLAAMIVVLLSLFFTFATGTYRVNTDVTLEGALRRVISAPFNGYVSNSAKRAGDIVSDKEVLARLDDRELRLERIKWSSEYVKFQRQHREAMAKRNRAQVNILGAQIQQAKAQLDLAESRLNRTSIIAPFAGLIVTGDLSQRLGAAIQQGEVLFEITPLENYRVILQVDEKRIAEVKIGQRGPLVLSSLPEEEYYFIIEKILPTTTIKDGENLFRVEARLENPSPRLRPGMQGVGKVEIEQRRLISIWTQTIREWFNLQTWKWFGF